VVVLVAVVDLVSVVVILSAFLISNQGRGCVVWLVRNEGQGMSMCGFLRNDWLVKSTERTMN
jgi:hypothetical protein